MILVGNKVDLLPRDSTNYVHHLKNCLESTGREVGLRNVNLIHTALVSATTGFGIESLIDRIFSEWGFKGKARVDWNQPSMLETKNFILLPINLG